MNRLDKKAGDDTRRRRFFDERAEGWMDRFYLDPATGRHTKHHAGLSKLMSQIDIAKQDRVLDAGCGSGVLAPYILSKLGSKGRLWELDYAEMMIETNRRLNTDRRITFLAADIHDIPLPDSAMDVVMCFACFPHFRDKPVALSQIARILRPGGTLAIAHLGSSREINDHHRKAPEVKDDSLPPYGQMLRMASSAGFSTECFIDEPGVYLLKCRGK